MRRAALAAALVLAGLSSAACSTAPSAPRPTAADVRSMKLELAIVASEVATLGSQAKLAAPWSGVQLATIDAEVAKIASSARAISHHLDQLARAAGISP